MAILNLPAISQTFVVRFRIPFALNWTFGDLQLNPQFFMVAPIGDYQKGQLANPGKNHWMFDWLLGLSYLSHKTGTEFTMFGGFAVSTEDPATNYRNGDIFHLEATLQQAAEQTDTDRCRRKRILLSVGDG